MAVMYPSTLSLSTDSFAERSLFTLLQADLSNDFSVIHSKRWIDPDKKNKRRSLGECDFIILHPSKGILFIEAKTGTTFFCSDVEEYWYCNDNQKKIRNPLNQVINSQNVIIKIIKRKFNEKFTLPYNYALAFPMATEIYDSLPNELPLPMVILKTDLPILQKKIEKAMNYRREPLKEPIEQNIFQLLCRLLRSEFRITASLSAQIDDLNTQFFKLEKDQIRVLDTFESNKRVLLEGCAGSGKTILAVEKAQRASIAGKKVLLLCFNIPLAQQLICRLKDLQLEAVDTFHFHGLCEHIITLIDGIFVPNKDNLNHFYEVQCPERLLTAIPKFLKRYDCIIVDEAQDFMPEWWLPIIDLMDDRNKSELYIFRDLNQNIFSRDSNIPIDNITTITLNTNYRNTPAITEWINDQCGSKIIPSARLDEGNKPQAIIVKSDESEINQLEKIVINLVKKENLKANQIIILGRQSLKKSILRHHDTIGGLKLIDSPFSTANENAIRYSSVYRFKGLEADCVLCFGFNRRGRDDIKENYRSILMAGASRAKSLLYLLN
jgi:superfamily I DNA and RNA helicase